MLLFKILAFKDKVDVVEKWVQDPGKSAREYAKEMIIGYASAYIIAVVLVLGVLALLGFSPVLGGPHQPARILLYALLVVAVIIGLILFAAYQRIKKIVQKVQNLYKPGGKKIYDRSN